MRQAFWGAAGLAAVLAGCGAVPASVPSAARPAGPALTLGQQAARQVLEHQLFAQAANAAAAKAAVQAAAAAKAVQAAKASAKTSAPHSSAAPSASGPRLAMNTSPPSAPSSAPSGVISMRNLPDPVINEQTATPASSVAGFALTWDLSSLTVAVGPGDVGGQEVFTGGTVSLPATVPTANATSPGWPEIDACGVSGSAAYTVGIYNDANPVPTSTPAGYAADTCVPLASVAEDVIDGITGQQWVESTPTWFSMEYQPTTALTSGAVSSPTSSAAAPS